MQGQGLALLIGIAGGFAAYFAGLPLPWMLGPMIANTIAAMAHVPVRAPVRLRPIVMPVIGVLLGSAISPEVFGMLGSWIATLLVLPVFLGCAALVSYAVYRWIGAYDPVTAYYAAMPGGLNDMLIMGAEAGVPLATNHVCGMFGIFFTDSDRVTSFEGATACDVTRFKKFFHGMLDEGIYLAPSAFEAGFVSAAHGDAEIEATIEAAKRVFNQL